MAENSIQESFVYEWLAGLLTALPAQIPPEIVSAIFTGCANVHYRRANIEAFVAQYVGNLDAFLQALAEQWHWKIDYNPTAHTITADENKAACVCPLVQHYPQMPAILCHCSERFAEKMFSAVTGTPIKASVLRSILRGDPSCVYQIRII
jgi:hypothetical protein